jgi:LmbE family N-acetylglucosaminyl deacetylase
LAIGAHPDDIELGCGGALLAHRACGDAVSMLVMSKGELGPQDSQPRAAEQEVAARVLGAGLYWGNFDDAAVPDGQETVALVQDVMAQVHPDIVYTHSPFDSHQDHRATASATLAAARRSSRILLYEAPSSLGFTPTVYVDIASYLEGKLEALRAHMSQVLRNGLVDLEAIEAQARYRGFQARIRWAEGFIAERFVWDVHRSLTVAEPAGPLSAAMFRDVG